MGGSKNKKGSPNKNKDSSKHRQGGESKTSVRHRESNCTVVGREATSSRQQNDDLSSAQSDRAARQVREADQQVGTHTQHSGDTRHSGKNGGEALMPHSISPGFEAEDVCYNCDGCRGILKEMLETHPQKGDYIAKFKQNCLDHAVRCGQVSEGTAGEQTSDVQLIDVTSSIEDQPKALPEHSRSYDAVDEVGKAWDASEKELGASSAEERSIAGENYKDAGRGCDNDDDVRELEDGWTEGHQQHKNKRRNEDNHSRERRDNQKGRRDRANWRMQDRGRESDSYCRNVGGGGGRGPGLKYEGKAFKIVKEVDGDLFTAPKEWSLAHCVATDLRMGSGIAVTFRQNFKCVGELLEQGARVGQIAILEQEGRYIYYLVTKRYSTEKPYFEDLVSSLKKMRDHCAQHNVKYLAMPRIGCGLDRLEWREVKPKIEEIFSDLDIIITVYNFNQLEDDVQQPRKKRHLPIKNRRHRLVEIEIGTALLFFGSEDGSVDQCGNDLDRKFGFMMEYRNQRRAVGNVIRLVRMDEVLYGLIVKKRERDAFSYIHFENCLYMLRKFLKSDKFVYVGVEAFCESGDTDAIEKVITLMKNFLTDSKLELYVCWPKELECYCRQNLEMKP